MPATKRRPYAATVVVLLLVPAGTTRARQGESIRIAENILLYQRHNGGWPKNYDEARRLTEDERKAVLEKKSRTDTTFDNGATHSEIRRLARAHQATGDERFSRAALGGIAFMLQAQDDHGGWPQYYPRARGYSRYITFNDNAMIGVMTVLSDVAQGRPEYRFADEKLRARAQAAVEKGIECVLKCQIVAQGKKTAWCAQHDEKTFLPQKARSYELPSISGAESVSIVRFLMRLDAPSPEVVQAIQAAVSWFDEAKLEGIRQSRVDDESAPGGWDKVVVKDAGARPMWARFYDIATNRPIFCSRDGIPKATLAEISHERRTGYSWLGYYATALLAEDYPAWQKKWAPDNNVLEK